MKKENVFYPTCERESPRIYSWDESEREYFGEKRVLNEQMSIDNI